uniref:E3 ubiquitin-protein ligase TRIM71 n=2 Tax=Ciona intestinalis TaxID=7719 RepID=A0A1W3JPN0_CIOIN|nr:E3 ubiquitin-protein ligase TRIM71 isoform X2 [Ciona intestinalis]XP_009859200.1 E3 ubiquitin-protein ligase TRIM71 isoform X2 [Ciona intestinalis]XP_018668506.1 E3 ubiquitin-protein ligase TRIM71 isoform X2 [Ciona intestinalis]XP_018668507.1 E3 ubiquitin-protein ligase TRIM71 isoform X2 [Ciona intestinalis]|eukprot:XP_009859199.1 E3 ubiquitin-protein ligase TRIM71 isoform X2 [Ciona intestinalis]
MMNSKRSPAVNRRSPAPSFQTPRPYSMYVSSRHLKTSQDNISLTSSSSSSSFSEVHSTNGGNQTLDSKQKRNSSAELLSTPDCSGVINGLVCGNRTLDVYENSSAELTHSRSIQQKKKKKSPSKRLAVMQVAGPNTRTWLTPKTIKRLATPGPVFGTCISKSGNCYVSVVSIKGERLIQAYDKNCNLVKSFPTRATKGGKVFEPYQIYEMPDDNLAVACGNCVTVWTKEGKLVVEHGRNLFKFAKFLAVRSTGEIVVADSDGDSVKIISAGGQQINKLNCDFKGPTGVAVDSNDNIIVADWKDQIRIFDTDNVLVRSFGHKGDGDGEFDLPYGISVDCEDNIVISDMWNDRVSIYTSEGQFIKHIVPTAGISQILRRPAFISVSCGKIPEDNRLAVTDFLASAVRVFSY